MNEVIELDDSSLVNTGTNRACYIHPHDQNKCIKITISGNPKESKREMRYYRLLQRRNTSMEMLAIFYGTVETNLGLGEVVELIRDYNGDISKEFSFYMNNNLIETSESFKMLDKLKEYLLAEKIIVKDLNTVNIAYQKYSPTEGRLVIIDGTMNSEWIPISTYIPYFTHKKILKIWKKFIFSLEKHLKKK